VEVPVKLLHERVYVRISAHIYNTLDDYQGLATAVSGIDSMWQSQGAVG
jgi:selenocysteine lyase/cysteine desulfurase